MNIYIYIARARPASPRVSQPVQLIRSIRSASSNRLQFSRPLPRPATCPAPHQRDSTASSSLRPQPDQMRLRCPDLALPTAPTGTRAPPVPSDLAHAAPRRAAGLAPAVAVYRSRWTPWGLPLEVGERPTCESSWVPARSCLRPPTQIRKEDGCIGSSCMRMSRSCCPALSLCWQIDDTARRPRS
jgi:hypothetical protein